MEQKDSEVPVMPQLSDLVPWGPIPQPLALLRVSRSPGQEGPQALPRDPLWEFP